MTVGRPTTPTHSCVFCNGDLKNKYGTLSRQKTVANFANFMKPRKYFFANIVCRARLVPSRWRRTCASASMQHVYLNERAHTGLRRRLRMLRSSTLRAEKSARIQARLHPRIHAAAAPPHTSGAGHTLQTCSVLWLQNTNFP